MAVRTEQTAADRAKAEARIAEEEASRPRTPGRNKFERGIFERLGIQNNPDGTLKTTDEDGNLITGTALDNVEIDDAPRGTDETVFLDDDGNPLTQNELVTGAVGDIQTQADAEFASQQGTQRDLQDLGKDIEEGAAATDERIGDRAADLDTQQEEFNADIDQAKDNLDTLAQDATSSFDRLKNEFGDLSIAALDRVDEDKNQALEGVYDGMSAAMQSAVQGIQGNVASSIAKIQSNPNLTQAQKTSMIAQTQLAGASSMAPAVGATILGFNTLAADVATKFGAITGNLEAGILGEQGAFGRSEAETFASATVAAQEITSTLLGIQANADASYATAQATLEGIRTSAALSNNQLLAELTPMMGDPVLNITDASMAAAAASYEITRRDWEAKLGDLDRELTMIALREQAGTWLSRLVDDVLGFVESGLIGGKNA